MNNTPPASASWATDLAGLAVLLGLLFGGGFSGLPLLLLLLGQLGQLLAVVLKVLLAHAVLDEHGVHLGRDLDVDVAQAAVVHFRLAHVAGAWRRHTGRDIRQRLPVSGQAQFSV